jgi:hypothetical protein
MFKIVEKALYDREYREDKDKAHVLLRKLTLRLSTLIYPSYPIYRYPTPRPLTLLNHSPLPPPCLPLTPAVIRTLQSYSS